jgi:hypothetical protein
LGWTKGIVKQANDKDSLHKQNRAERNTQRIKAKPKMSKQERIEQRIREDIIRTSLNEMVKEINNKEAKQ